MTEKVACDCNADALGAPARFHEPHCAIIKETPQDAAGIVERRGCTKEEVEKLLGAMDG